MAHILRGHRATVGSRERATIAIAVLLGVVVMLDTACGGGSAKLAATVDSESSASTSTVAPGATTAAGPAASTTIPGPDPAALAAGLDAAERAIRDPATTAAASGAAGRTQQQAYRALAAHPELESAVLSAVSPGVRPAVEANLAAGHALATIKGGAPTPTLPAWKIDPPVVPEQLLAWYHEAAQATGVPWSVLAAINLIESRMGRIRGYSTAGARGPMQFLPSTWAECCKGNIDDPHDAIIGAATYLVRRGARTDLTKAIRGYNPSDGYVTAVKTYASVMDVDERAYLGYHAWEVYVGSTAGAVRLPVGYDTTIRIDAATYLAAHPESRA